MNILQLPLLCEKPVIVLGLMAARQADKILLNLKLYTYLDFFTFDQGIVATIIAVPTHFSAFSGKAVLRVCFECVQN